MIGSIAVPFLLIGAALLIGLNSIGIDLTALAVFSGALGVGLGFGDSSVDLELRIWINDPQNGRGNVISEVLLGVWDRFKQEGIEIPYPQRDLHIRGMLSPAADTGVSSG